MKNDTHNIPSYSYPYKVIDGCLFREKIDKYGTHDQKLCNFLPYIVSEVTLDNGVEESKQLRLGGFRCDGSPLPEIEVSGSELGSFNWLIDKWGADCILEIGQSVHDSVRYAIQLTAKDAEHQTIYEVTGWKKIGGVWSFLLLGDADHTVRLPSKLSRYALPSETLPEALPVLAELIGHPPAPREVIWPLLAYTFLSPLNHFLHEVDCEPKFLILFLGRTGTGKSTLSSLFLSFFGHFTPSDLPISFRDTKNSINQCCAMLNDVLTCVDDFRPSGRKEEQELMEKAQMLARAYGDRVGRGRLRADSTLMPTRPVRGNAILTAEFPPEIGESGLARCFTVELRFGDLNMESYRFFEAESRRGVLPCFVVHLQEGFVVDLLDATHVRHGGELVEVVALPPQLGHQLVAELQHDDVLVHRCLADELADSHVRLLRFVTDPVFLPARNTQADEFIFRYPKLEKAALSFLRRIRCAQRTRVARTFAPRKVFFLTHMSSEKTNQIHFAPVGAKKHRPQSGRCFIVQCVSP